MVVVNPEIEYIVYRGSGQGNRRPTLKQVDVQMSPLTWSKIMLGYIKTIEEIIRPVWQAVLVVILTWSVMDYILL